MSKHRAEPPRHRGGPTARGRARPRFARLGLAGVAALVTTVAFLGATGVLPSVAQSDDVAKDPTGATSAQLLSQTDQVLDSAANADADQAATTEAAAESQAQVQAQTRAKAKAKAKAAKARAAARAAAADEALPAESGQGRRVVFSEDRQRVWLVGDDGQVLRTYLASGSAYDNLFPGTYSVFSRTEQTYAFDGSGSMKYFVGFTRGRNAVIGFHDIPLDNSGQPVQTLDQLGTPLSHGCIRQERSDAIALWEFTPIAEQISGASRCRRRRRLRLRLEEVVVPEAAGVASAPVTCSPLRVRVRLRLRFRLR